MIDADDGGDGDPVCDFDAKDEEKGKDLTTCKRLTKCVGGSVIFRLCFVLLLHDYGSLISIL